MGSKKWFKKGKKKKAKNKKVISRKNIKNKYAFKESFGFIFIAGILTWMFVSLTGGLLLGGINKFFIELLITISIAISGFCMMLFQLGNKKYLLKKNLLNIGIIMLCSAVFGFLFLAYEDKVIFEGITIENDSVSVNYGHLAGISFLFGFFLFLILFIEERLNLRKTK